MYYTLFPGLFVYQIRNRSFRLLEDRKSSFSRLRQAFPQDIVVR